MRSLFFLACFRNTKRETLLNAISLPLKRSIYKLLLESSSPPLTFYYYYYPSSLSLPAQLEKKKKKMTHRPTICWPPYYLLCFFIFSVESPAVIFSNFVFSLLHLGLEIRNLSSQGLQLDSQCICAITILLQHTFLGICRSTMVGSISTGHLNFR